MVRFDIDRDVFGRVNARRAMVREAIDARQVRSATSGRRATHPGVGTYPVFEPDKVPDFDVVIVLERFPENRVEARLRWLLYGQQGDFPVIPESELEGKDKRKATMPAHGFRNEREATVEAARQASALIDEFMQWATNTE
jgi:hypothetical protein